MSKLRKTSTLAGQAARRVVTVEEASALLQVNKKTLYAEIEAGPHLLRPVEEHHRPLDDPEQDRGTRERSRCGGDAVAEGVREDEEAQAAVAILFPPASARALRSS
jgi:hypothetical protein